jgi:uncharacterized Zn-binding protein involved in type VI secretion
MVPSPAGEVPTPSPHPFNGILNGQLSPNTPPHIPQGGRFQRNPGNRGEITTGSQTVFINGKPAARVGDTAKTCNDPADLPVGKVVASGTVTVFIG